MRPTFTVLAALGLLLVTLGTTTGLAQTMPSDDDAPELAQGPGADGAPGRPARAVARLSDPRNPFFRGTALLEPTQSGGTAVTVTVYGLGPGGTYINHIHNGSCTGPILFPLDNLVADATGTARAVTQVRAPIDTDIWWVNVHASYFLPTPGITCGKVETAAPRAAMRPAAPPQIPEADSVVLVGGGLLALAGLATWRARRA
jgi:hypothetical protein